MADNEYLEIIRLRKTGDRTDKMAATFMLAGYERDVAMQMAQTCKEAFAPFVTSDHEFDQACLTVEQCHLSGRLGPEEFRSLNDLLERCEPEPGLLLLVWRWLESWIVYAVLTVTLMIGRLFRGW